MYVQTEPKNKDGRILMYYAEGYRENGFIDEFTHLYEDPIALYRSLSILPKYRENLLQQQLSGKHQNEFVS